MKVEAMSRELMEMIAACKTAAVRSALIKAHHIKLTDEQAAAVSGGVPYDEDWCTGIESHCHDFAFTGETRPGLILGDLWPDYFHVCKNCGQTRWLGCIQQGKEGRLGRRLVSRRNASRRVKSIWFRSRISVLQYTCSPDIHFVPIDRFQQRTHKESP